MNDVFYINQYWKVVCVHDELTCWRQYVGGLLLEQMLRRRPRQDGRGCSFTLPKSGHLGSRLSGSFKSSKGHQLGSWLSRDGRGSLLGRQDDPPTFITFFHYSTFLSSHRPVVHHLLLLLSPWRWHPVEPLYRYSLIKHGVRVSEGGGRN